MKRSKPAHMSVVNQDSWPLEDPTPLAFELEDTGDVDDVDDDDEPLAEGNCSHDLARHLILKQARDLLPPAEANALADHLLTCDSCFRFAQDVAAREHRLAADRTDQQEESRPPASATKPRG